MTVTINGTTGVQVPLGSVSAPGVSNTTSSTTGIYNPTGTTLAIATNGTAAVTVDASQNVGIGTASPTQKLQVIGSVQIGATANPRTAIINNAGTSADMTIGADSGISWIGSVTYNVPIYFAVNNTERMRIDTSGNLQVGGTTVGNTAGYVNSRTNARAWCNFNGTLASPITPRAAYNVSSVTKNATGDYTLNFTTALADANYVPTCFGNRATAATAPRLPTIRSDGTLPTTTAFRFEMVDTSSTGLVDMAYINVAVFGN